MTTVSTKLPDLLLERLDRLAGITDRKRSYLIKQAVESYLEDEEDCLIASSRLASGRKRISLEDLEKKLGL